MRIYLDGLFFVSSFAYLLQLMESDGENKAFSKYLFLKLG